MAEPSDVQRRLVAVFAADVEGYSRLMGADEVSTLRGLTERRAILDKAIADHRGRIANTAGDSVLAEFGSAVDAVQCAVEAQEALAEANASLSPDRRINFRIGIHVGDVMVRAGDLFGDGVNIAARLQTLAQAGGVCVSGTTHEHVRKVMSVTFTDLGAQRVKNIEESVRAYTVAAASARASSFSAPGETPPLPDKPSIAVLPFQNMSGDPEQEYFADGMVEDIITALSRFKSLFVIARNSSFTYKGQAVDVRRVGRELGVRYVLEGSVRKAGSRVRITGQLIEAATGTHLWADRFDGALENVFELQDDITINVVGAILPRLERAARELLKRKLPESWDAYDHYLRGKTLLDQRTLEATNEAQAEFLSAITLDPDFGLACAYAAFCTFLRRNPLQVSVTDEECSTAVALANRAIALSSHDDQVLGYASWVLGQLTDDFQRGFELVDQAISLNPNSSVAWLQRGWLYTWAGDFERALDAFARTVRLNPLDHVHVRYAWFGNSVVYLCMNRFQEGVEWASKLLARNPVDSAGLLFFIENAARAGRKDEAEEAVVRYRTAFPNTRRIHIRRVYQRAGGLPDFHAKIDVLMNRLGLPE